MKKRISSALLLCLLLSLLLCGCAGTEGRALNAGQKALSQENYADAAAAFEKAGTFQDAELLLRYANAFLALEAGDCAGAAGSFAELGDFKDSRLMQTYCLAREQETLAQEAAAAGDADAAVKAGQEAFAGYSGLALFRDSDTRAADCRYRIYTQAEEWMRQENFDAAAGGFAALEGWQDSTGLEQYCRAASLEQNGRFVEAAALFAEMPDVLNAGMRADEALKKAYGRAAELMTEGEYGAAEDAFAALGSYRDAAQQRESAVKLQIRKLLQSGAYADALEKLTRMDASAVFPPAEPDENENVKAFLHSFISAWMNAYSGVMTGFFSRSILQPYLEPGGELDTRISEELTDESYPQNYSFAFYGSEIKEMLQPDDGFVAAKVLGTAGWVRPDGPSETDRTLWILLDTGHGSPVAVAVQQVTADS